MIAFQGDRSPRVLVVEDDDIVRGAIVDRLTGDGYRVAAARDGGTAVRSALAETPDLVLLDVGLPVMDGLEALRHLRMYPQLLRVHVIVLSAFGNGRDRELAFEAGCNEFIAKPSDPEAIARAVRTYFVRRGDVALDDASST